MIRISGFILGMVLVVTVFLLVLKPDDATRPGIKITSEPIEAVREHANPWLAAGSADNNDLATDTEDTESLGSLKPKSAANEDAEIAYVQAGVTGDPMPPGDETGTGTNLSVPAPVSTHEESEMENTRYLFWSPFRSEWAAQGFAGRLAVATSVPVEVVEDGAGKYRVGFSYRDEAERRIRIDQIESVTGLQLE